MAKIEGTHLPDPQGRTRPRVIAHRGASAHAPENTLEAFHIAADQGVDGVELDVHETADGRFVVHHDPDPPGGLIADLPLAALRGRIAKRGGEIPALTDVLDLAARRRPGWAVCVEVKGMRSWPRLRAELAPWRDRLHLEIQSFELDLLRAVAADPDGHRLGVIALAPPDGSVLDALGAVGLSLRHDRIGAGLAAALHAADRRLYAWTVNDVGRAQELAALGVDAIISDEPDRILLALRNRVHRNTGPV